MANLPVVRDIFDIVDESDQVIGSAPRSEVHRHKLRHRAIHVFLFNTHFELFVQKRAVTKDTFPGRYDSSASGHVDSGEDYDVCARREVQEEIGLVFTAGQLVRHLKIEACSQTGWEFVWVYSAVSKEKPVINRDEIQSGEFWTTQHIRSRMAASPAEFAPAFVLIFNEFERRGLFPSGL